MTGRSLGRVRRLLLALAVLMGTVALLYALLLFWSVREVKAGIHRAAEHMGVEWVDERTTSITIDLWEGDLRITDMHWAHRPAEERPGLRASGCADSIIVQGLAYGPLLFRDRFSAKIVACSLRDVHMVLHRDTMDRPSQGAPFAGLDVGIIDLRATNSRLLLADSLMIALDTLTMDGSQVVIDLRSSDFTASSFLLASAGIRGAPVMDSSLTIGAITLDGTRGDLFIHNVAFGPTDLRARARELDIERDVISGSIARVDLLGLDMDRMLDGIASCRSVHLGTSVLSIARDKVLRDGPFVHKRLPAGLLRTLPLGSGTDSLIVHGLQVDYFERVDAVRGFAHLPFDTITGLLLNVRHSLNDTMSLRATGRVFRATPLSLELRSFDGDSADRVTVKACIGRLPFPVLKGVTAPLLGVATPEGRLDTMIVHMTGGDRRAEGRCWMRYDGLKLDRRGDRNKALDPVLDGLLNAVVKGDRNGEEQGDGWEHYAWERRRDRSVFNYLWSGVREGANASMLPRVIAEQMAK